MAHPQIRSQSAGGNFSTTSPTTVMPATISAGDLLVMLIVVSAQSTFTLDAGISGWTALLSETNVGSSNGQACVYYKVADGTEDGATYTHTLGTSRAYAYRVWALSGVNATSMIEVGTTATATSAAPDCPNITASWGSADNLFLAFAANFDSTATVSAYPASYTGGANQAGGGASGVNLATATREYASASDNPAAMTLSASKLWRANTIAIRPTAATPTITDVDGDESVTAGATGVVLTGELLSDYNAVEFSVDSRRVSVPAVPTATTLTFDAPTDADLIAANMPFGACTISAYMSDEYDGSLPSGYTFGRSGPQTGIDGSGLLYSAGSGVAAYVSGQGVLLEGSRTNICLRSTLEGGGSLPTGWTDGSATGTSTSGASSLGNADNAVAYTYACTAQRRLHSQNVTLASNTTYSMSVYVESFSGTMTIQDAIYVTGLPAGCTITGWSLNGVAAAATTGCAVGRITMTIGGTYTGATATLRIGAGAITGNVTATIRLSRPQIEAGAFASSYIQTTTAAVTRSAASLTKSHTLPSNNVSFHVYLRPQVASTDTTDAQEWLTCYYDASNYLKVAKTTTSGEVTLTLAIGGVTATTTLSSQTWAANDRISVRGRKNSTGIRLWVGSNASTETTSGVSPNAWSSIPNVIRMGQDESTNISFVTIEALKVWHESKSDAFMAALT